MKTQIILMVLIAGMIQPTLGQRNRYADVTRYGVEIAQFKSASGFQSGYEVHFTVQPSQRAQVGFGLFLDNETKKLSGLTISHKRMLRNYKRNYNPVFEPYVLYNFIYRKTNTPELINENTYGSIATYTSMEHHLGLGVSIRILKSISLNSEIGYGLYLGSIKHPSKPDPITREISGTSGFGKIVKIGLGYRF